MPAEQPSSDHTGTPGSQEYSWEDVARQMPGWHPDLQRHALNKLARLGLTTDAGASVREMGQLAGQSPAIPNGEPGHPAAEQARPAETKVERPKASAETISDAFVSGRSTMYKLSADPRLHAKCIEADIDPFEDIGTRRYWDTVAAFSREQAASIRERRGDSVHLRALELMATTPQYLLAHQALRQPGHRYTREGRRDRRVAISFNKQLRDFATAFPETNTDDVEAMVKTMADMAFEEKPKRQAASQTARETIRGAQFELGFGQLLAATGRKYSESSEAQDGQGKDFTAEGTDGRELRLDAKASLHEVEALRARELGRADDVETDALTGEDDTEASDVNQTPKAYAIKPNGTIVIYAMLHDHHFGGKFFVPQKLAQQRGAELNWQLQMAEQELPVSA